VTPLLLLFGYLCGSLPTGAWFARQVGVDVRSVGSGNVGATNVARTAGARAGIFTLLADIAKGLLPTLIAAIVAQHTAGDNWRITAVGFCAFLGHVFPIFSGFSGGKGVATAFGAFVALAPLAAAAGLVVFVAIAALSRYVSVASMLGAITLAVGTTRFDYAPHVRVAAFAAAAIIIIRHRENIVRLWRRQEPKFQVAR